MALFRRSGRDQTPPPSSDLPPTVVQQQKTTDILRFLMSVEGEPGWTARHLLVKPLLTGTEFLLEEESARGTGQAVGVLPPQQTLDIIQLQRAMATANGTWLTGVFSVTSAGAGDARFNYDEEPVPVASEVGYPVDELRAHLEAYPRTDAAMADWMRERLA